MNAMERSKIITATMESQNRAHAAEQLRWAARYAAASSKSARRRKAAADLLNELAAELDTEADEIVAPFDGAKGALDSVRKGFAR